MGRVEIADRSTPFGRPVLLDIDVIMRETSEKDKTRRRGKRVTFVRRIFPAHLDFLGDELPLFRLVFSSL